MGWGRSCLTAGKWNCSALLQSSTQSVSKSLADMEGTQLWWVSSTGSFHCIVVSTWSKVESGSSANVIAMGWSQEEVRSRQKEDRKNKDSVCESLQFTILCSLVTRCSCWLALDVSGLFSKELGSPNTTDSVNCDPTPQSWSTGSRPRLRSLDTFRGWA